MLGVLMMENFNILKTMGRGEEISDIDKILFQSILFLN